MIERKRKKLKIQEPEEVNYEKQQRGACSQWEKMNNFCVYG